MKSTDSTNLIETVIASGAASGYVTTIPTDQATAGDGTISLTLGSPPECAISVAAGGKRPLMKDVNGVYKLLSAAIQSLQSWGLLPFSATFGAAIGGYPEGATVADTTSTQRRWVSSAENNLTTPGATSATWRAGSLGGSALSVSTFAASGTYSAPYVDTTLMFRVRACGAGGGGDYVGTQGAYNASSAGGGSAGAYCEVWLTYEQLFGSDTASSVSVTVGAGGSNTGDGGSTSVGSAVYAPGGNGADDRNSGAYSTLSSGASATALCTFSSIAPIVCANIAGAAGGYGITTNPQEGGEYYGFSGAGGSSPLGTGGEPSGINTPGKDGGVGAGGSGACAYGGTSGTASGYVGGKGGDGQVIIECFTGW